jgi:hypothetical protein
MTSPPDIAVSHGTAAALLLLSGAFMIGYYVYHLRNRNYEALEKVVVNPNGFDMYSI